MKKYKTIKELVLDIYKSEGLTNYDKATLKVKQHFPDSKWNESHFSWYKSQIKRNKINKDSSKNKAIPVVDMIPKLKNLTSTQKGVIAEHVVANELMIQADGRLSPFCPLADDEGIDLLIYDKKTGKSLPIQMNLPTASCGVSVTQALAPSSLDLVLQRLKTLLVTPPRDSSPQQAAGHSHRILVKSRTGGIVKRGHETNTIHFEIRTSSIKNEKHAYFLAVLLNKNLRSIERAWFIPMKEIANLLNKRKKQEKYIMRANKSINTKDKFSKYQCKNMTVVTQKFIKLFNNV